MKNISRIDQTKKKLHGWYLRVYYKGQEYRKFFADNSWGSKVKALKAAKRHRKRLIKIKNRLPNEKRTYDKRFYYPEARNRTTGVVGIYRTYKRGRDGSITIYYSSTVSVEKGKPRTRSFNADNMGEKKAFLAACDFRREGLKEIFGDNFNREDFRTPVKQYLRKIDQNDLTLLLGK